MTLPIDPGAVVPPPPLPSLARNLVDAYALKGLWAAAVFLTAHGLLGATRQAQFVELGLGGLSLAASAAATWLHETSRTALSKTALGALPPWLWAQITSPAVTRFLDALAQTGAPSAPAAASQASPATAASSEPQPPEAAPAPPVGPGGA